MQKTLLIQHKAFVAGKVYELSFASGTFLDLAGNAHTGTGTTPISLNTSSLTGNVALSGAGDGYLSAVELSTANLTGTIQNPNGATGVSLVSIIFKAIDSGGANITLANLPALGSGATLGWSLSANNLSLVQNAKYQVEVVVGGMLGGVPIKLQTLSKAFTYDNQALAPTLSLLADTGSNTSDGLTKIATVNVLGVESGATWSYQLDGGNWTDVSNRLYFNLSSGVHTYSVKQTDLAGNTSVVSSKVYTLDQNSDLTFSLASDTGASASDGMNSSNTVNVLGIESGAIWQYQIDNNPWIVGVTNKLFLQEGRHNYRIKQTDLANNESPVQEIRYTLDTRLDAFSLQLVSDNGLNSSDNWTSVGLISLSNLENGATWSYQVDGTGGWISGSDMSFTAQTGLHTYRVQQTDLAGNVGYSQNSIVVNLDANIPLEIQSSVILSGSEDGYLNTQELTTTQLTGSVLKSHGIMGVSIASILFKDQASASAVDVTLSSASLLPILSSDGTWTLGNGAFASQLQDGKKYQVIVNLSAMNGNSAVSKSFQSGIVTIDKSAPASVVLTLSSDTGMKDNITSNAQINLGSLEVGASWSYQVDGAGSWIAGASSMFSATTGLHSYQVRQTDVAGNSNLSAVLTVALDQSNPNQAVLALSSDTGISSSDGITSNAQINVANLESGASWSYQIDGTGNWLTGSGSTFSASAGLHSYQVKQTDTAGNSRSTTSTVNLDKTPPLQPSMKLASDDDTSSSDGISSQSAINITGLEAGASWEYQIDDSPWKMGQGSVLTGIGGQHTYAVRQRDVAGNLSGSISQLYTIVGTQKALALSDIANEIGGFVINGAAAGDRSGFSIEEIGDVNNDGLSDFLIGAINKSHVQPSQYGNIVFENAGASYIVFGKAGSNAINLDRLIPTEAFKFEHPSCFYQI